MARGQTDNVDRISELPDFILHEILTFLNTRERCRTSILSKRWADIWESCPVLDFGPEFYEKDHIYTMEKYIEGYYDEEFLKSYVNIIDSTMERYSRGKYGISSLKLDLPKVSLELKPVIDKWFSIAVENQVKCLNVTGLFAASYVYRLPEVLFSATSLRVLDCTLVDLPYHETMRLTGLQCMKMANATIDEHMLQRMVSSCPLIELDIYSCEGISNVSLPWSSDQVSKDVASLRDLTVDYKSDWSFELNVGALGNLRKLDVSGGTFSDETLNHLVPSLVMLETLRLRRCNMLKRVIISCTLLKEVHFGNCKNLEVIIINSPKFHSFSLRCTDLPRILSLAFSEFCYTDCSMSLNWSDVDKFGLIRLMKFLKDTNVFDSLDLWVRTGEIDFDEDGMMRVYLETPYKLKKLKLTLYSKWRQPEETDVSTDVSALLDYLVRCCCPEVLCIEYFGTSEYNVLDSLKDMVNHWKHPMKRIEVNGVDHSDLILFKAGKTVPNALVMTEQSKWSLKFSGLMLFCFLLHSVELFFYP